MNNKRILKAFFLLSIILIISIPQLYAQMPENKEIKNNSSSGTLLITDISFQGLKIITTIKSIDVDIRTLWIDYYKSRIVNGVPTEPIPIGSTFISIKPGDIKEVPKIWLGFGHYIIYVKASTYAESSQEVVWFLVAGKEII